MAFYHMEDGWEMKYFRKKASTAFTANSLVAESSAIDTVEPADASDAALVGICMVDVASTDDDYASNTLIPVLIPKHKGALMEGPVSTGTIAATDEGNTYDLADANGVDQTATSNNPVRLYRFVSSTLGLWTIESSQLQ